MNRDDIIRMAADAGILPWTKHEWLEDKKSFVHSDEGLDGDLACLVQFANLVAAAEREILANWMRQHGFSTGQAYTTDSLLDRLGTEMVENVDAAVLAEREACAKLCEKDDSMRWSGAATAIRARGEK